MSEYTPSRFAYFDTNILSHLAKKEDLWAKLSEFLTKNELILGIGGAQVVELADAKGLHSTVAKMLGVLPSGLLKPADIILGEEVKAHPRKRPESLLLSERFNKLNEMQELEHFLSSEALSNARKDQLNYAQKFSSRHHELKGNFPVSKTGKYSRQQADEFAQVIVMQWLKGSHYDFLVSFRNQIENFYPEAFLSIRLFAYVIFYKYYLGQREPVKRSDFGDLAHLFVMPYCELVVLERDLCNILNQIKRNQNTLASTIIRNIDFLEDWTWH